MAERSELVRWNGRNSKLTVDFINSLDKVLSNENTILYNQEEIIMEANENLPPSKRIAYSTYKAWKRNGVDLKNVGEEEKLAFLSLSKKIRRIRKQAVAKGMLSEGAGSWQKFAWIGERIDPDLHLTQKVETEVTHKGADIEILPPNNMSIEEAEYKEIED